MKLSKRLLSLLMTATMVVGMSMTSLAAPVTETESLKGKTVILHTNDVHGAIMGYAQIAQLKTDLTEKGAEVIMADAGDYFQGEPEVSFSEGATAVEMMNLVGYDVATIGNHEFDYSRENLETVIKDAKFDVVSANVKYNGNLLEGITSRTMIEKGGVKIGFFGLTTPETYTKANPALMDGMDFGDGASMVKTATDEVAALKTEGADLVIGLVHLGVADENLTGDKSSINIIEGVTGIDFIIDGHSHTAMTPGEEYTVPTGDKRENKWQIQSTGTKTTDSAVTKTLTHIGVVVIDNASKKIESSELITVEQKDKDGNVTVEGYSGMDKDVAAAAQKIIDEIDAQYGEAFAKTEVDLNGERAPGNRTEETNLGDLVCDSLIWIAKKEVEIPKDIPEENIVSVTNGGGIRASIAKGNITRKDVKATLPFGNTVSMVYISGKHLLEALEASTFASPDQAGAFPQIGGMKITIDVSKPYDKNDDVYPKSTYYGPKTIQRVTINEVNGKPFDEEATYAVVSNNFLAAGGDTYYVFKNTPTQMDTGFPLDEVLVRYIQEELGGTVGTEYEKAQGRITFGGIEEHNTQVSFDLIVGALAPKDAYVDYSAVEAAAKAMAEAKDLDAMKKALDDLKTAAKALEFKNSSFADADPEGWYDAAVDYVAAAGLMQGTGAGFAPGTSMTRGMVVTVIHRMAKTPDAGDAAPFTDLTQDWYKNAVTWAFNKGVVTGVSDTAFNPDGNILREQMAAILVRYADGDSEGEMVPSYSDAASISDYAKHAVARATEMKMMQGSDNTFRPQADMTRAECAQVLYNIYQNTLNTYIAIAD